MLNEDQLAKLRTAGKVAGAARELGLSMVKQISDAHGGRLSVESKPGAGSTFSFSMECSN